VYVLLGPASEVQVRGDLGSDHELAAACVDCGRSGGGRGHGDRCTGGAGVSSVARGAVIVGWGVVVGTSRVGLLLSGGCSSWALLAALAVLVDVALATGERRVVGGDTGRVAGSKVAELCTTGGSDEGVDGSGGAEEDASEGDGRGGEDEHRCYCCCCCCCCSLGYSSWWSWRECGLLNECELQLLASVWGEGCDEEGPGGGKREEQRSLGGSVPARRFIYRVQSSSTRQATPINCHGNPFVPASLPLPLPTKMLGKLVHLTADALIISAFLAGIKRSTGLTSVPVNSLDRADCFSKPPGPHSIRSLARTSDVRLSFSILSIAAVFSSILLVPRQTGSLHTSKQARSPAPYSQSQSPCSLGPQPHRRIHLRPRRCLPRPLILLSTTSLTSPRRPRSPSRIFRHIQPFDIDNPRSVHGIVCISFQPTLHAEARTHVRLPFARSSHFHFQINSCSNPDLVPLRQQVSFECTSHVPLVLLEQQVGLPLSEVEDHLRKVRVLYTFQ
jgi:hypothetical protein